MQINTYAGASLLETTIALAISTVLITLLISILQIQITQSSIIQQHLTNSRQLLTLHQILKHSIHPSDNNNCTVTGSRNILTNNDTLHIKCCPHNNCTTNSIYLSAKKILYRATDSNHKDQIARNICKFQLWYGTIKDDSIKYYPHHTITNWQNITIIKAAISNCPNSPSTIMEITL